MNKRLLIRCALWGALLLMLLSGCASSGDTLTTRQKDLLTYGALTLADAGMAYVAVREGGTEVNALHAIGGKDAAVAALSVAVTGAAFGYLLDRMSSRCGHDHRAWRSLNLLRGAVDLWNVKVLVDLRKQEESGQ